MTIYAYPLLTADDLAALTGYARPAEQRRWLAERGIRYAVRRDGGISTTWGLVEAGLMGGQQAVNEPNFEALRHGPAAHP